MTGNVFVEGLAQDPLRGRLLVTGTFGGTAHLDNLFLFSEHDLSAFTAALVPEITDYATWQTWMFRATDRQQASKSGPAADPDQDGWSNALEYALGLQPELAEASDWFQWDRDHLQIRYRAGLDLQSRIPSGATSWQSLPDHQGWEIHSAGGLKTRRIPFQPSGQLFRVVYP